MFERKLILQIGIAGLPLAAILLLPYPLRDVMLMVAIGAATLYAFRDLEMAWLVWLALFPLARLSGGLLQMNPVNVPRIIIVLWVAVYLFKYRNDTALRHLFHSKGFVLFAVFILANIIAALRVARLDSLLVTFTYLEPLLYFGMTYCLVYQNPAFTKRIFQALLWGGLLVIVVGLVEMATQQSVSVILYPKLKETLDVYMYGWDSNRFGLGGRISSLIAQPVIASLYFVVLLVVAIYYLVVYERPRWLIVLFAVSGLASVLLLLATGTRGGLVSLGVALLILVLFGARRARHRFLILGGIVGVTILAFLFVPTFHEYLVASLDFSGNSRAARNIIGRWALTMELLRIFRENWFLGYGPGLVQKQGQSGELPTVPGIQSLGGIENQYATILADGGIVAGFAYLLFMLGVAWQTISMFRQPRWRTMGLTLLMLFAAYFAFAATETTLIAIPNLMLMTVFGAFAAEYERASSEARA